MKKINYDDFIKAKKEKYFDVPAKLGRRRSVKKKPRNPEERNALMKLDYLRYRKWIEKGDLIEVTPRKYILKI
jgi:hypothetical protein